MDRWLDKVVPPILTGAVLWGITRPRIWIRRQNESNRAGRGYYLEVTIFGNRRFFSDIPFYVDNNRLRLGSNVDKFHLTTLPSLPFRNILHIMHQKEQVKLAMTSKKTWEMIRKEKLNVKPCYVYIQEHYFRVTFGIGFFTLFCGPESQANYNILRRRSHLDVPYWKNPNLSHFQNTIQVLQKCQSLYPRIKSIHLVLAIRGLESSVQEVLNVPAFQTWTDIKVVGFTIEATDLDLIMETANAKRSITLEVFTPENYSHENAFKFHDMTYPDAHWVTLDHLLTLRNTNQVCIGRWSKSQITFYKLNLLIKHWVLCDYDMFRQLFVTMEHTFKENIGVLFKDLEVVKVFRATVPFWLIASKSLGTKKFPLLSFSFHYREARFDTFNPNNIDFDFRTPWTLEYKILEVLNRKKVLVVRLNELYERFDEEETALKIEEVKQKIQKLERQLRGFPIYYEEGGMLVVKEKTNNNS